MGKTMLWRRLQGLPYEEEVKPTTTVPSCFWGGVELEFAQADVRSDAGLLFEGDVTDVINL